MIWKRHALKLDLSMSKPFDTGVICTDFGATLDLAAEGKDNSSTNNHFVIDIFFV